MKKSKQDFFVQMKNYKIANINKQYNIAQAIVYVTMFVFLVVIELILWDLWPQDKINSTVIGISAFLFIISFICYTITVFKKNSYYFKNGDISSGIKNYTVCGIVVYVVLGILFFTISDKEVRSFVSSLYVPVTTVLAAVLAMLGVHYTHSKQQKDLANRNNLIFKVVDAADYEIEIQASEGEKIISICLQNVSDNYGYFIGLYNVCGCDVRRIGEDFLYQPIMPQKSYIFTNIHSSIYEEDLILVYKDVGENYYYIHMIFDTQRGIIIKAIDKCNIDFLNDRLEETVDTERSIRKSNEEISQKTTSIGLDEFKIKQRKEETKPKYTRDVGGYDLIVDQYGNIVTDTALLSQLKAERAKIAKDNKIRAYMILNNQQLVAIATYKPTNREDFISIYGLGEKKYELYGMQMIEIVKCSFDSKATT